MKKGAESTKTAIKFFKQFLITNNALEGYLAGLAAVKEKPDWYFNVERRVIAPREFIFRAFYWRDTEEGYKYWEDLSVQWARVCDALNL